MHSGLYTHPAFLDVRMYVRKAFYIPEKDIWKLSVIWFHRRGYEIGNDKLVLTTSKLKEFKKI
jgi:hypothetical protein